MAGLLCEKGKNMKNSTIAGTTFRFLGAGAMLWTLITPCAVAGPEQDAELALKEFNRGDLIVAITLWRKSAQEGYAPAQVWLGDILDKAEEDVEAADWYRKAADQGNADGEFGLGQMFLKGEGVKKDFEKGRVYILRSAEKNNVYALKMMMEAYRNGGMGLPVDVAQADAWEAKLIAASPEYKPTPAKEAVKEKKAGTQ